MADLAIERSVPRGAKLSEVTTFLHEAISGGRFVPGQRLVEIDLTREIGISRSLLREALRDLAAQDLIELVPNRGAIVRRLSAQDAGELFEIRAELEALAAGLAADRLAEDREAKKQFEKDIDAIWEERSFFSRDEYTAENQRFHQSILRASGNTQLIKMYERMQLSLIMAQISSALTPEVISRSLAEHRAIAEAIISGDKKLARTLARDHLKRAAAFMSQMPAALFRQ